MIAARTQLAIATIAACVCSAAAGAAQAAAAPTVANLAVTLSPDRLGALGSMTFTANYSGGEAGVPAAVRSATLRMPAGLSLSIPHLHSCNEIRLAELGAGSCPTQSVVGSGHAAMELPLGSQNAIEDVTLQAFLGPPRNLQPTFEILGAGYEPVGAQMVLEASSDSAPAPYGEALTMAIPPIPTIPNEPDASMLSFSLTIGTSTGRQARGNAVLVPRRCPPAGFPFAAQFSYADGSNSEAFATVPCPRRASRAGRRRS